MSTTKSRFIGHRSLRISRVLLGAVVALSVGSLSNSVMAEDASVPNESAARLLLQAKTLRNNIRQSVRPYKIDIRLSSISHGSLNGGAFLGFADVSGKTNSRGYQEERDAGKGEIYEIRILDENGKAMLSSIQHSLDQKYELTKGTERLNEKLTEFARQTQDYLQARSNLQQQIADLDRILDLLDLVNKTADEAAQSKELRDWAANSGIVESEINTPRFDSKTECDDYTKLCIYFDPGHDLVWTRLKTEGDAEEAMAKWLSRGVTRNYLAFY